MTTIVRLVLWSCIALCTFSAAVPLDGAPPEQHVLETKRQREAAAAEGKPPSEGTGLALTEGELLPGASSRNSPEPSDGGSEAKLATTKTTTTTTPAPLRTTAADRSKLTKILAVESSTEGPCPPSLCDAQSALLVTADPAGNKTGYVARPLGFPVSFQCALLTQGRQTALPVIWRLPNTTEVLSDTVHLLSVELTDSGEYTCLLAPHECCSGVKPNRILLSVYELSQTAGLLLMLSVLTSIVILVGVFIYSQKKKKYHTWLKHEILAASSSSGGPTPSSSLNRDMQANNKKYLLNA